MKEFVRKNYKLFVGIIIGSVLTTGIVFATVLTTASEVFYDNTESGIEATNMQAAVDELYEEAHTCKPQINFKVGDYVKMTPTSKSYTTSASSTGYSAQTINPSELNLWRIIGSNSDGTYDAVSANVSSTVIYFTGYTGFANLTGVLNTIASQYANKKYTVATRHMGYNGQSSYSYSEDTLYTKDYNLVRNALGSLAANKDYWLPSRYVSVDEVSQGNATYNIFYNYARYITSSGGLSTTLLDRDGRGPVSPETYTSGASIRPIITLKASVYGNGYGTSADPYVLVG